MLDMRKRILKFWLEPSVRSKVIICRVSPRSLDGQKSASLVELKCDGTGKQSEVFETSALERINMTLCSYIDL